MYSYPEYYGHRHIHEYRTFKEVRGEVNTNFFSVISGTKSIGQTSVAFKRKPSDYVYIPFIKW